MYSKYYLSKFPRHKNTEIIFHQVPLLLVINHHEQKLYQVKN